MTHSPPRLARWLVGLASPSADRPWVLGDLEEEFVALAGVDAGAAHRWYWRQALSSTLPLVRRRFDRSPHASSVPAREATRFDSLRSDLRHSFRAMARTKTVTAAILGTMALGIGATAAISTVVWKVVLRPLPLPHPERVLAVYRVHEETGRINPSNAYPDIVDWNARTTSFSAIAPYTTTEGTLLGDAGSIPITVAQVGDSYFSVLGLPFALGRPFDPATYTAGAEPAVILSEALWRREFGGDPAVLGRSIAFANGRAIVVGVVDGDAFTLPVGGVDVWTPLLVPTTGPNAWMNGRGTQWLQAVARVRPGVDVGSAIAELQAVDRAVQREFPRSTNAPTVVGAAPLGTHIAGPVRPTLLFLAGAIVIVLLAVCTNIASLLLVRTQSRERELSMRIVLGAGLSRLRRHLLLDAQLLAVGGAVLGLLIARPILAGLLALYPGMLPRRDEIQLDPWLAAWSFGIAIGAGLLFAIPQVVSLRRLDAGERVRAGERGGVLRRHGHARRAMVVIQLASSVMLLVAGGVLVRTMQRVASVTPGFTAHHVLSFALSAPASRYQTAEATEQLYAAIAARLRLVPGVQEVEATNALPLTTNPMRSGVSRPGADPTATAIAANQRLVTPGYLSLLEVPVVRGRPLDAGDVATASRVAMINASLAAELYPGEDAIGKTLPLDGASERVIVGVVGDLHHTALTATIDHEVYIPFAQAGARRNRVIAIRTLGDPGALIPAVERAVREVDSQLPIRSMRTLDEVLASAIAPQRFRAAFIGSLALLTLTLAVIGIHGVMSFTVAARTRELGIRMALGDTPARVRGRVIGDAMRLAVAGTAIGVVGALAGARVLRAFVFEIAPADPWTLGGVVLLLTTITMVSADGPARRASRVDPLSAIRTD